MVQPAKIDELGRDVQMMRRAMAQGDRNEVQAMNLRDRSVELLAQARGGAFEQSAHDLTNLLSAIITQNQFERQMRMLGIDPKPTTPDAG